MHARAAAARERLARAVIRVLGGALAVVFALACALLLLWMLTVSDFALCSDHEGFIASGEDDCIDGSSGERTLGLVLGWGAAAGAALAAALGVACARGRRRGAALAAAAIATPVLAIVAVYLLPISF